MSNHRRTVLICYDIADPRRLRRVFRELQDVAWPLQKSVFLAELSASDLDALLVRLEQRIEPGEDRLQVFFLREPERSPRLGLAALPGAAWVA
jgi:CRISPR-associated protein Cas2